MSRKPVRRTSAGSDQPPRLVDLVGVQPAVARSANLERDSGQAIDHYVPTARVLDALHRWAGSMLGRTTTRSWSITGPYGSGKSSLALVMSALSAGAKDPTRLAADRLIRDVNPELADLIEQGRLGLGAHERGFVRALVTAEREPVVISVLRALDKGASDYWRRGRKPTSVREVAKLLRLAESGSLPSGRDIVDLLSAVSAAAPVLLVIDEFGKNLEYLVASSGLDDAYGLQQIAEANAGKNALPVFLFTLQHMSFSDYLSPADDSKRREWAKIHGRFEDVPFVETREQTISLIRRSFLPDRGHPDELRIRDWARDTGRVVDELGLGDLIPDGVDTFAATFPLHPVTLLALPDLCAQYGQHERTLFSFLGGGEPSSVGEFISTAVAADPLPTLGLDIAYEYFVGSARVTSGSTPGAARWLEIETRIREAYGLADEEQQVLRIIGVLNLVSQGGSLRASKNIIAFALGRADKYPDVEAVEARLRNLEDRGYLTYREFADEYRLWQGTDFDLTAAVDRARQALVGERPARVIDTAIEMGPIIALRHTQEHGTYRHFDSIAVDSPGVVHLSSTADGGACYWLGDDVVPNLVPADGRPLVILESTERDSLFETCLDAAALRQVLDTDPLLKADWVARVELTERAAEATARARTAFQRGFDPTNPSVRISVIGADVDVGADRLSRITSDICDRAFVLAPLIRNEMLSRDELTTQAARARRELMGAIASRGELPRLGIEGYGPDRALYEAIVAYGGFHREGRTGWTLSSPPADSTYHAVWLALDEMLSAGKEGVSVEDVEGRLRMPPYGVPRSVTPILLTLALTIRSADLAIYQDGTYAPVLTPELLERMVKIPGRFRIRSVGTTSSRNDVLRAVARSLGISPAGSHRRRNASVLALVAPLMAAVRDLPPYTVKTRSLSAATIAVRERLLEAREPDRLIFEDLPVACGFRPFELDSEAMDGEIDAYAEALATAVRELRGAYRHLLRSLAGVLAKELGGNSDPEALRAEAQDRTGSLVDRVFEPRLRSFVHALNDSGLEDDDWLAALGLNLTGRPSSSWGDDDETRFGLELRRMMRTLQDAEVLSFESLAPRNASVLARRVTVTSPDGTAVSRVVWLETEELETLRPRFDEFLASIERTAGIDAIETLLAVVAERIQVNRDEETNEVTLPTRTEGGTEQ